MVGTETDDLIALERCADYDIQGNVVRVDHSIVGHHGERPKQVVPPLQIVARSRRRTLVQLHPTAFHRGSEPLPARVAVECRWRWDLGDLREDRYLAVPELRERRRRLSTTAQRTRID